MKTLTFNFLDKRESHKDQTNQDRILAEDNVFGVADGVTVQHVETLPDPPPSVLAADIALKIIRETLKNERNGLESIKKAAESASDKVAKIKDINKFYAGTTLAYGFLDKDILYFGQLNDSGVMVFDKFQGRELDLIQNQTDFILHLREKRAKGELVEGSKEEHIYVREQVVNKKCDFSVLNGDPSALDFLRIGAVNVAPGQIAFFYTDGFIPFVYDEAFVKVVFDGDGNEINEFILEKEAQGDKYKKEKSIVILQV